jgi:hypothetical protein
LLPTNIRLSWKGFVNYGRKKFYNIGPRSQCYKDFYERNLEMFEISKIVLP